MSESLSKLATYQVLNQVGLQLSRLVTYLVIDGPPWAVATQIGVEAWASGLPNVVLTQIGVEAWAQITPANVIATQIGVEAWMSVAAAPTGGPIISLIM